MRRKLAVLALVLAATMIANQAKPTLAADSCHCDSYQYFTDATKTERCGLANDCSCDGGFSSGCETPYYYHINATYPCCP